MKEKILKATGVIAFILIIYCIFAFDNEEIPAWQPALWLIAPLAWLVFLGEAFHWGD